MTQPFKLDYGDRTLTMPSGEVVRFRVWRDDMHGDHVMATVNDRDAGGFDGYIDRCQDWATGWISGRLSTRLDPPDAIGAINALAERTRAVAAQLRADTGRRRQLLAELEALLK